MASVDQYGIPRFWATIWIDVLKSMMEPSTKRKHLIAWIGFMKRAIVSVASTALTA
ncbi:hypothetical protein PY650_29055 [Rhizobium calliandrae]|uniref:Uncharacterized protein n=1 Tax=Rhizobium calliandrae TaxID=1312182 RepID=A0ABT7KN95_9HYPH|nr:hypothetical protein [Rhizobium calliandrae]MDL2409607.1 hypothetical protein [Rhizobium calliandrae]